MKNEQSFSTVLSLSSNSFSISKTVRVPVETPQHFNEYLRSKKVFFFVPFFSHKTGPLKKPKFLKMKSLTGLHKQVDVSEKLFQVENNFTTFYLNFSSHDFGKTSVFFRLYIDSLSSFSNWVFAGWYWEWTGIWAFNFFYCFTPQRHFDQTH